MARKRKGEPIHHSIKERLGYEITEDDNAVYEDWKERTSRVCKPCWELKYCPYGPLVEQSPTLPPLRTPMEEKVAYFKKCLETNTVGDITPITESDRAMYAQWLEDEDLLRRQALNELGRKAQLEAAGQFDSEEDKLRAWLGQELPPIQIYRMAYEMGLEDEELQEENFEPDVWKEILAMAAKQRDTLTSALQTGVIDHRSPLEPVRRLWFQKQVDNYAPDELPDSIPATFTDGECNIFGHICPVFFAAEAATETEEERRIGRRRLSFATMMRIVRRDDYRCQHCQKQLRDTEVEFDHIIPISKGGNSEEHNLRLTCFDCNRDKGDDYTP